MTGTDLEVEIVGVTDTDATGEDGDVSLYRHVSWLIFAALSLMGAMVDFSSSDGKANDQKWAAANLRSRRCRLTSSLR